MEGNPAVFRQISEEVIREKREKHHHLLANDLERILYGRSSTVTQPFISLVKQVPNDKERGLPLLHIKEPTEKNRGRCSIG
uniref:Uncharacterized protein n=1 Tax=Candidatus Kentrum sp. TUN TaxID=2126343 RepID=A0A450ZTX3_9GAMM|nr:MAG: hypothetical protein BECKTUN1418F_GA0071002_11087 [Candidatus Kentron sp. TUN]VFK64986.1 MAG: hypothetical protein BECKTUN1418D_GA0071000_13044 [Candidatus Kentron sp. TUN]VFK65252.1 MAG: hypothetical protein BECKTUN1418E_GA0071001_11048 [Candidatus Kentron sp. TUN]